MIYFACTVFGLRDTEYIDRVRKHPRVHFAEEKDGFALVQMEEPLSVRPVYMHSIFHTKPIMISAAGEEIWSVASVDRQHLISLFGVLKKVRNARMVSIREEDVQTISIAQFHPRLTRAQREAVELAIQEGYYQVPRRTSVQKLAKISGLAFSTFQAHMRKAEAKLIPYSFLQR